jgi:hypothetical protein
MKRNTNYNLGDWLLIFFAIFAAIVFVGFIIACIVGITEDKKQQKIRNTTIQTNQLLMIDGGDTYKVVVFDGCQYIKTSQHIGYGILSHKGNCTNRIHIYNNKLEK